MSRRGIDFEGVGAKYATVQAAGSVSAVALVSGAAFLAGKTVTCEGNGQYGFGNSGDPLKGVIDKYEDDHYMSLQYAGFRTVAGISGALPTAKEFVCVDGAGSISECALQTAAGRGPAYAVSVDDTANVNTVTIFIG